ANAKLEGVAEVLGGRFALPINEQTLADAVRLELEAMDGKLAAATERAEKAEREREDAEAQLESQQRIIQAHHEYQAEALRVLFGAEFEEKSHEDYMQALKALKARAEAAEARAEKAEKALVVLRDAAGTAIGKLQDIASAATDAYCNEHDDVCCATCIQDTANEAIAALKEAL
ncbi:MAG: hypothetical protein ABFD86_17855, partial [Bryobacteraceae bacterium]